MLVQHLLSYGNMVNGRSNLQLPFHRIQIFSDYPSEKKAVEGIRQLLINREPEMVSFSEVVQLIESYKIDSTIQEKDLA